MNLLDMLRSRGLAPVQVSSAKGGEYASPCPGCGGKDRFHTFPEQEGGPLCVDAGMRGTFFCRQCGAAGDALEFLTAFQGMSFAEACRELSVPQRARTGKLPTPPRAASRAPFAPKIYAVPSDVWRARAASLVEKSHARLLETPKALAWLAARGLDADAVRRYRLGYLAAEPNKAGNSTGIYRARSAWGLEPKEKRNPDGSLSIKRSLWIPRGIVIPAYGPEGYREGALPIRIRIRRPDVDVSGPKGFGDKYMVIEGSGMAPMLLGADRRAVVVVEAELDALLLHHHAGDLCGALAVLTNLGKPDAAAHAVLSRAFAVLVALDYDAAGASGWFGPEPGKTPADGWRGWKAVYPQARRWPTPTGKDPGDAWKEGEDLRAWALAGLPANLAQEPTPAPAPAPTAAALGTISGAASPTGEGEHQRPAAPEPAAPAPEPTASLPILQRVAQLYALKRLAAFMERNCVSYGPDSSGQRAWLFPATLSPREVDALFDELLPLVPADVYELVLAHPARVVTAGNLCAPYQPQRRTP